MFGRGCCSPLPSPLAAEVEDRCEHDQLHDCEGLRILNVPQATNVDAPAIEPCESALGVSDVSASDDAMSHFALPWFVDLH